MFFLQALVEIFATAIFECLPALMGAIAGAAIGFFACGSLLATLGCAVAGAILGWTYDHSAMRGRNRPHYRDDCGDIARLRGCPMPCMAWPDLSA